MSDLISRSAVLNRFSYYISHCMEHSQYAYKVAYREVETAHAVDAVPVVRCRECWKRGGYHCPMYHTETSLDDLDGFDDYNVDRTDDDGFCEVGRRHNAQTNRPDGKHARQGTDSD